jgi:ATP-binding cassette subfamily B protein
LSVGQSEVTTVALAIISNPVVMIMGSPTSDLDPGNARKLQGTLKRIMWRKTAIIVANRLSAIKGTDIILLFLKRLTGRERVVRNVI